MIPGTQSRPATGTRQTETWTIAYRTVLIKVRAAEWLAQVENAACSVRYGLCGTTEARSRGGKEVFQACLTAEPMRKLQGGRVQQTVIRRNGLELLGVYTGA